MIASFRVGTSIDDEVAVQLGWKDGARAALVDLPRDLQEYVDMGDWPDNSAWMSIEAALAYGIFVAMRAGRGMVLSGDLSAWKSEWGELTTNTN